MAVVLDLILPQISGRELCQKFKTLHPETPVLVLSAITEVVDKVLLLELGADDYVTKPFSPRELMARVQAVIRRRNRPTAALEQLAASVRAFGIGDSGHPLPLRGTREVRDLSASFSEMGQEIQQTHRALLESERLATIGRMASSVSHDLRHYLAAVYANAEFLASARLTEAERAEILDDIHAAVYGTAELIESMLIFSRTGNAIRRTPELIATILNAPQLSYWSESHHAWQLARGEFTIAVGDSSANTPLQKTFAIR